MKRSLHIVFFILILLTVSPFCSFAQKLTATASSTTMATNNSIQVTYSLSGGKSESFQQPSFNGFSIIGFTTSTGGSGMTIYYNGKKVDAGGGNESWMFTVVPAKTGKITIDPAKVKVKGQWISSNTLTIDVSKAAAGTTNTKQPTTQQTQASGDVSSNDLFVKAYADKSSVMLGEQITVTYKIYTRIPITQYAIQKLPSFTGFWSNDLMKGVEKAKQYNETVNGQKYLVAEIRKVALFPQKSGKLTVDPLELDCVAEIQVKSKAANPFSGFFNDPFFNDPFFQNQFSFGYQQVKKSLKSNGLSINVTDLPSKDKPDDFSGFVGSLSMDSKLDRNIVKANEPINLTITLSGKGNLSLLDKLNVEFPPDFEVYDPQITENISTATGEISGSKTFNYLILPRTPGDFKIKPITLTYFDKNKKTYVTLTSGEISVKVGKGDGSAASITSSASKEDIKYIGSDIKFINIKTTEVFPNGSYFFASFAYFALLLLPVVLFIAFIILMRRRIKLHSNTALLKHKRATKIALKRLKQANIFMKAADKNNFYIELSRALWGYISDKFSIPLANLSLDSAHDTLTDKHVSEAIRNKFIEILNNCEFARFAPAEANVTMESIYNDAVAIISQTEQELK